MSSWPPYMNGFVVTSSHWMYLRHIIWFFTARKKKVKDINLCNLNQSSIARMKKMNLAMSSAACPPFYLADNQLITYVPHYNFHRLHWCGIFLCSYIYMLWYFYTSMFGIIVVHWSGAAIVVSVLPSLVALESVDRFQCNLCRLWRSFFARTASVLAPVLTLLSSKWGHCKINNGKNLWYK